MEKSQNAVASEALNFLFTTKYHWLTRH